MLEGGDERQATPRRLARERFASLRAPQAPHPNRKAQQGRDLRNQGRMEDGKAPKTTKPGTGHPDK
jgi:hypothetical protein